MGIVVILAAQLFNAGQQVFEEALMKRWGLPELQIVGEVRSTSDESTVSALNASSNILTDSMR